MTPRQEIHALLDRVAHDHGVPVERILSGYSDRNTVAARDDAMYRIYRVKYDPQHWSFVKIGHLFGRHHTCVRLALGREMYRRGENHKLVTVYRKNLVKMRNYNRTKSAAFVANVVDSSIPNLLGLRHGDA